MSNFKKFILILGGVFLVSGSATYAISGDDFYQEAATYSYQFCQSVSPTNRQQNTICFLLYMQAQNQIRWALQGNNNTSQQEQIDALEEGVDGAALNKANTYTNVSDPATASDVTPNDAEAFCDDANDVLLSGGHTSTADKKMHVSASHPGDEAISSWVVTGFGEEPNGFEFQAYANCYSVE